MKGNSVQRLRHAQSRGGGRKVEAREMEERAPAKRTKLVKILQKREPVEVWIFISMASPRQCMQVATKKIHMVGAWVSKGLTFLF